MYSNILNKVRTKEEALRLEEEVDLLLKKIYETKEGAFEEALEKSVRSWVSEEIKMAFAENQIEKEGFLKGVKEALNKLKILKLTLAFEPVEETLDKIHSWVLREIGEGVVIEIAFNPNILAGAIIIYEGKYKDYSFRKKFEEDFKNNREEIMKVLGEEAHGISGITTELHGK